jgi:hypothetical protein
MSLQEQIAERLGVTTKELMLAVTGEITATNIVLHIIAILLILTTIGQWIIRYAFAEGDREWNEYHRVNQYYIVIGGIMGFILLMVAIRRAVMYDAMVMSKLLEMANALGVFQ